MTQHNGGAPAVAAVTDLKHRVTRMTGRNPHEGGRAATNLELFFDLTFVVAFAFAGVQVSHYVAEGHYKTAVLGFVFTTFAAIWAWINFTWFASAFDTDDWVYRLTTMIQMIGVLILALGIEPVFESIDAGGVINNRVLVLGYVVMRLAMVVQWVRAAAGEPRYRTTCLVYAGGITVAQIAWVAAIFLDTELYSTIVLVGILVVFEMCVPVISEKLADEGSTPWHAHHVAERYGLLAIITLGEGIVGTAAALQAVVHLQGWTVETAVLGLAGVGITFGMWWIYFVVPSGRALHRRRGRAFVFGYFHIIIFMSIAMMGAGLHVAALYLEHEATIGETAVVVAVVIPVGIYLASGFLLYGFLLGFDRVHLAELAGMAVILSVAVVLAAAGVSVTICLMVVALAPALGIVVDELSGGERTRQALEVLEA
ncbi:UNVERIFIED_CONTAM: low temperature requirement protein LtrA [Williamsia faeni]